MGYVLLSRRVSAFLLAVGVWTWVIWPTFLKNIWKDDRSFAAGHKPTSFLIVHALLVAVSLLIGTAIGVIGWRGWRASSREAGGVRAQRRFVGAGRD
jgi:cytochrome b